MLPCFAPFVNLSFWHIYSMFTPPTPPIASYLYLYHRAKPKLILTMSLCFAFFKNLKVRCDARQNPCQPTQKPPWGWLDFCISIFRAISQCLSLTMWHSICSHLLGHYAAVR